MAILDRRKDRFVEDQDKRVSVGIDFPFGRVGGGDGYFKSTKGNHLLNTSTILFSICIVISSVNGSNISDLKSIPKFG